MIAAIFLPVVALASCGGDDSSAPPAAGGTPTPTPAVAVTFTTTQVATYGEPWAIAFAPGTPILFVTEKPGTMKFINTANGTTGTVSGVPVVDYGGQGGLGDIAFLPAQSAATIGSRTIYLSWAEAGPNDTRGAAVGRGTLTCPQPTACEISGMQVIWRQSPKVTGRGHYSHRISVSPDGQYLFIASGDRQKGTPAQNTGDTIGDIVRLNLDGTPASGNPLAAQGGVSAEIWSWGHRNILGMDFDAQGRLWEVEHGPAGGDELNLVERGANYGWPVRSNGDDYNGTVIPDHTPDDGFAQPKISWTPVIAPGDMIIYNGTMFPGWRGKALIAGLGAQGLVEISFSGTAASESRRYPLGDRIRSVAQGPDGAVWVAEDGADARLLKLTAN
jgi:glucose/arabinose dehydrogenase